MSARVKIQHEGNRSNYGQYVHGNYNSPLAVPWFKAFPNERTVCIILFNFAELLI